MTTPRIPPVGARVSVSRESRGTSVRVKLRWTVNGTQTGVSKTFPRSPDREERIAQFIESIRMAKRERLVPRLTLQQFVVKIGDVWLEHLAPTTAATYASALKTQVVPYFGDTEVTQINVRRVRAFARQIEKDSTRTNSLAALSRICKVAIDLGYLENNPVGEARVRRRTQEVEERPVLNDATEVARLINEVRKVSVRYADALAVTTACALRIGETAGLQAGDYDPQTKMLKISRQVDSSHRVRAPKWGSTRSIPVNPDAHAILVRYQNEREAGAPLFGDAHGGRLSVSTMRSQLKWSEMVERLGHAGLRIHDLRHTGLTHLVPTLTSGGLPITVVMKIAGHRSISTTQGYLHTLDRDLVAAARLLWDTDGTSTQNAPISA